MSTMPCANRLSGARFSTNGNSHAAAPTNGHTPKRPSPERPLHRLKAVRQQQGVSLRRVARTLKIDMHEARQQEHESSDLKLSTLHAWRELLDVPMADLLEENTELSPPVLLRARLLKLMKTATAIRSESSATSSVNQLACMLIDQLIEIMPELAGVSPWHIASRRRRSREIGRIFERIMPASMFPES